MAAAVTGIGTVTGALSALGDGHGSDRARPAASHRSRRRRPPYRRGRRRRVRRSRPGRRRRRGRRRGRPHRPGPGRGGGPHPSRGPCTATPTRRCGTGPAPIPPTHVPPSSRPGSPGSRPRCGSPTPPRTPSPAGCARSPPARRPWAGSRCSCPTPSRTATAAAPPGRCRRSRPRRLRRLDRRLRRRAGLGRGDRDPGAGLRRAVGLPDGGGPGRPVRLAGPGRPGPDGRAPRARVYYDAGHSGWDPPAERAALLREAGAAASDGVFSNVSDFRGTADEIAYDRRVLDALGGPAGPRHRPRARRASTPTCG